MACINVVTKLHGGDPLPCAAGILPSGRFGQSLRRQVQQAHIRSHTRGRAPPPRCKGVVSSEKEGAVGLESSSPALFRHTCRSGNGVQPVSQCKHGLAALLPVALRIPIQKTRSELALWLRVSPAVIDFPVDPRLQHCIRRGAWATQLNVQVLPLQRTPHVLLAHPHHLFEL